MVPGYTLARLEGFGPGDADTGVNLFYEGPGFPILVSRERIFRSPIDIFLPPEDALYTVEAISIDGVPAVVMKGKQGSK
ncbi:MAG TPA: hypothetical protein VNN21_05850, partial [Dehalococcoidia bacterium]|nr:hypothetical protein [Dehalococcoidia bacterium]